MFIVNLFDIQILILFSSNLVEVKIVRLIEIRDQYLSWDKEAWYYKK